MRLPQAFACLGVFLLLISIGTPPSASYTSPSPSPAATSSCTAYQPGYGLSSSAPEALYTGPQPSMAPWVASLNNTTPTVGPIPTANPSQAAADQATGQSALNAQNYGDPSSSPGCPSPAPVAAANASLLEQLYAAANAFRGTDTCWANTDCGVEACAASVQKIVQNATGATIGDYSVDDWRTLALSSTYGGSIVTAAQSKRGAIIIWPEDVDPNLGHMGFCAVDGCTQTWSNSSSRHTFAPQTWGLYFDGTYSTYLIWEPGHIP